MALTKYSFLYLGMRLTKFTFSSSKAFTHLCPSLVILLFDICFLLCPYCWKHIEINTSPRNVSILSKPRRWVISGQVNQGIVALRPPNSPRPLDLNSTPTSNIKPDPCGRRRGVGGVRWKCLQMNNSIFRTSFTLVLRKAKSHPY